MRILSGCQPSGQLHLGIYFGAIRQYIEFQEKGEGFYFIATLHALTSIRDPDLLRQMTLDVALDYLALGLDPSRSVLWAQQDVPEVCELSWILSTVTPMALLERGHSYKDKIAKGLRADHGLFAYPVLMAADILLYKANLVPVGKDQKQHLEMTRDIATKFNMTYCKEFDAQTGEGGALILPEAHVLESTAVVPGIDGQKMSKSYGNGIPIFDTDKRLKKRVMSIVTDSTPLEAPKQWQACNVYALMTLFMNDDELSQQRADYENGGVGYGHFKLRLLEKIHDTFGEARARREDLATRPDDVRDILADGASKAREVAATVLDDVKRACGIR